MDMEVHRRRIVEETSYLNIVNVTKTLEKSRNKELLICLCCITLLGRLN